MAQKPTARSASVIPFRPSARVTGPSIPLPLPLGATALSTEPLLTALDLSGKIKVIFVIGRGRLGKTKWSRWAVEVMDGRGGTAIVAAADPINRSIRNHVDGIAEPEENGEDYVRDWLRDLLMHAMEYRRNVIVDLGGGNTSLSALMKRMPDMVKVLSDGGIEAVAIHLIGPDPHDLVPLALAEAEGFQPAATALILNEAHGRRSAFGDVINYPTFQAAIARGAVQLWMPWMDKDGVAACSTMRFHDAATKAGPFTASVVRAWLDRMGREMQPIASWLPE
jgi:hypothetical protein